jgi:hypothetical protein
VPGGRLGRQVLVDLVEFAVDRRLALQVLTVQPLDQLMIRLPALVVGVVAIAEQELATRRGMLPDPPAAWLVAVVLLDQLVDTRADRAEDAELFDVRADPGPEPVIRAGLVDGARVHLEPVTGLRRVRDPQDNDRQGGAYQASRDDQAPLHRCSPPKSPGRLSGFHRTAGHW